MREKWLANMIALDLGSAIAVRVLLLGLTVTSNNSLEPRFAFLRAVVNTVRASSTTLFVSRKACSETLVANMHRSAMGIDCSPA